MHLKLSQEVDRKLQKLKQKNIKLFRQIERQLALFIENPRHPSLRIHKLSGELKNMWSLSISKSVRMVYILEEEEAFFVKIGTHNQVYRP